MKNKKLLACLICWLVLAGMLLGLRIYAGSVDVEMEPPIITQVELSDENDGDADCTIKWTPVDYATSYRIYRRLPGEGWSLLQAVSRVTTSYVDAKPEGATYQYAVKAINKSFGKTHMSDYSQAFSAPYCTEELEVGDAE